MKKHYEVSLSIWFVENLAFEAISDMRAFQEATWLQPRSKGYDLRNTCAVRGFLDEVPTYEVVEIREQAE